MTRSELYGDAIFDQELYESIFLVFGGNEAGHPSQQPCSAPLMQSVTTSRQFEDEKRPCSSKQKQTDAPSLEPVVVVSQTKGGGVAMNLAPPNSHESPDVIGSSIIGKPMADEDDWLTRLEKVFHGPSCYHAKQWGPRDSFRIEAKQYNYHNCSQEPSSSCWDSLEPCPIV